MALTTQRLVTENDYQVTLTSPIASSGDVSYSLSSAPANSKGFLVISKNNALAKEIHYYHDLVGNTVYVKNTNRYYNGVVGGTSHIVGEPVEIADVAEFFNYFSDICTSTFYIEKRGALNIRVIGWPVALNGTLVDVPDTDLTLVNWATNYIYYDIQNNVCNFTSSLATANANYRVADISCSWGNVASISPIRAYPLGIAGVDGTTITVDATTKKLSVVPTVGTGDVTTNGTQTLTNKTMSGANNTFSNISLLTSVSSLNYPEWLLVNGRISTAVASNNLTVSIVGLDGNAPSASNPVYVRIGNTVRSITSSLSVTKNAGTNWCNSGSSELATREVDYFVYLGYNSTDGVTIGFSRIPNAITYGDFSATTTNEKYCVISTITNAVSTDQYVVVGRFNATLSAGAGYTWSIPATSVIINRPIYETRMLVFLPTYSTSDGAIPVGTYNATQTGRYQIRSGSCMVRVYSDGSTSSTPQYLTATLPFQSVQDFGSWACVNDGSADGAGGITYIASASLIRVSKWSATAFWTGPSRTIKATFSYFI